MIETTAKISPRERYPSGHPKPADTAEAIAPTLLKRLKDELIPRAKDKRLGSVLGILHLQGVLSEVEAEAGLRYAEIVGAYERMKGHPPRHSQSQGFEFGRKGADSLDLEALHRMDPETAEKLERRIKRKRKAVQKAYDRVQMCIPLHPILISALVEEVCCNDLPIHSLHHPMLKKILRVLAERQDLVQVGDEAAKRRQPVSRKTDAILIAHAAVDAIDAHFAKNMGTVFSFRLAVPHPNKPCSITAYGSTWCAEAMEKTVILKRSGLMAEAINAQLLKAAEIKGWTESATMKEQA